MIEKKTRIGLGSIDQLFYYIFRRVPHTNIIICKIMIWNKPMELSTAKSKFQGITGAVAIIWFWCHLSPRNLYKKYNINLIIQNNHIINSWHGATGGVTALIKNDISRAKIGLQAELQAVAVRVTLYRIVSTCSQYIQTNDQIYVDNLEDLTKQLPNTSILLSDLNSNSNNWGSKETNKHIMDNNILN